MSAQSKKVSTKERLAAMEAKREASIALKSDIDKSTKSDIDKSLPELVQSDAPKTLPKVTLYAHQDVLKAIRRLAVDDGVQAQEILRRAIRDYLATRGHTFTDLTTGI